MVARDDPLDTYLVNHPEALLGQPVEANVFDPDNPYVLGPAPVRRGGGVAADRSPTCRCSGPAPGRRSTRSPRADCCADGHEAGSGPTGAGPATSPTSAPPAVRRSGWSRTRPAASSAPSTRAPPTAPPTRARCTCTRARPGWSPSSTSTSRSRWWCRADPDYSTSAREITDIEILAERDGGVLGRGPAQPGQRAGHPPGGVVPEAQGAVGRGDRRGAARPARAGAADDRGVVDAARPRPGRVGPRRGRPARRRPRGRARLDRAAARCSPPATAGTSAASPPPCTPTPAGSPSSSTTGTPAAPVSPSAASTRPPPGCAPPGRRSRRAPAPTAARRACSPRSAATRTTRSTNPAPSRCSTSCSRGLRPSRVDLVGPSERKSPVFVAALIVLIVAVLLVIAALFGGGDATTIDMGSFNINGPAVHGLLRRHGHPAALRARLCRCSAAARSGPPPVAPTASGSAS